MDQLRELKNTTQKLQSDEQLTSELQLNTVLPYMKTALRGSAKMKYQARSCFGNYTRKKMYLFLICFDLNTY